MRPGKKLAFASALLVLGLLLTPVVAAATTIQFHDKDNFLFNDFVDWGQFGASPPPFTVADGSTATSSKYGLNITVSKVGDTGDFLRIDQGMGGGYFNGNFTPGDALLFTTVNLPPPASNPGLFVRITLPVDVLTVGLQMQPAAFSYGAFLEAYDKDGNKLGSTETDVSLSPGDPAAFVGIGDPDVKIRSILIYTQVGFDRTNVDFAFDRLEFYILPCAVPVPGAIWLLGTGLIGLGGIRRFGKN